MTSDHAQLLARVESFDIDGASVGLPFAARLARENGWSRKYAERVISEYKRFVFLAVTSDTPVCPSEDVDAAWHLHLTYTRSYWKRFCDGVLGRPLHHEPTRGGPDEHAKHLGMYARTLARYREVFGHEPPADVWPAAAERFGIDLAHRSVNTARNWVIPKAPVKRLAKLAGLFALVAVFVPGCEGNWNPFALQRADFLYFLIPMMVGAVVLGRIIVASRRGPAPAEGEEPPALTWEEAAYLAGGAARLTTAAIARLVACGAAKVERDQLVRGAGAVPGGTTAVEHAVLAGLPKSNLVASLKPVVKAVEAAFTDGARKLGENGLLTGSAAGLGAGCVAFLPLLLVVLVFAVPRWVMGVAGSKPTEYLAITTIAGSLVGFGVIAAGVSRLTRRGEYALARMKQGHRVLQTGAAWEGTHEAALAVALFGPICLIGSGMGGLAHWYPRPTSTASSGGCGTSGCGTGGCSGGAGGCGGGGGGGCGGGGCGGCGGGGGD